MDYQQAIETWEWLAHRWGSVHREALDAIKQHVAGLEARLAQPTFVPAVEADLGPIEEPDEATLY